MNERQRVGPIAVANPPHQLPIARSLEIADLLTPAEVSRKVLARLHARVGVEQRNCAILEADGSIPLYGIGSPGEPSRPRVPGTAERMKAYDRHARELAIAAARDALASSGVDAESLTHLVTASCTGFSAPGVDLAIVEALDLPLTIRRNHLGFMGCHAAVNALAVAASHAAAHPENRVLVVCVEVSSIHFHNDTRLDRLISNTLFADGAAATVVSNDPGGLELVSTASTIIPATAEVMGWEVGDHGFEMTLGAEVPEAIGAAIPSWVDSVLHDQGLDRADIGGWAIHPGGPKVIDAVVECLDLPKGADQPSRAILREHGNMSSSTLLHILHRLQIQDVPRPWVGLAFGPGLAGEFLLLK
ncbi:MAG: type III polyketide synthase [Planctomycetota bacterium]|jgi:predicted naringenin-chalcone synthase|nr:type III polyketide synthase [Planctomycetota bacterium]